MFKVITLLVLIIYTKDCTSQDEGLEVLLDSINLYCTASLTIITIPFFTQILDPLANSLEKTLKSQIKVFIKDTNKADMATKALKVLLDPSSGNDLCIRYKKMMILKKLSGKKKTTYVKKDDV